MSDITTAAAEPPKFKKNEAVFNGRGEIAQYIAEIPGHGHLVTPFYDGEEGWIEYAGNVVWPEVFKEEPVARLGAESKKILDEIEALKQKKTELGFEVRTLQSEKQNLEWGNRSLLDKLKQNPPIDLSVLEAVAENRVTHLVRSNQSGDVEILEWGKHSATLQEKKPCYPQSVRVLCLYADKNGEGKPTTFAWRMYHYYDRSDGGSTSHYLFPVGSLEDAKAKAAEEIDAAYEIWRKSKEPQVWQNIRVALCAFRSAQNLGFAVPHDVERAVLAYRVEEAKTGLDKAKKTHAETANNVPDCEAKLAQAVEALHRVITNEKGAPEA